MEHSLNDCIPVLLLIPLYFIINELSWCNPFLKFILNSLFNS